MRSSPRFIIPLLYFTLCFLRAVSSSSSFVFEDLLSDPKYEVKISQRLIPNSSLAGLLDGTADVSSGEPENSQSSLPLSDEDPTTTALSDHISTENDIKEVETSPEKIIMRNSRGQRFICSIPKAKLPPKRDVEMEEDRHEMERRGIEKGLKLLEPLKSNPSCLYYNSGWWTYEYCHLRHVRQFHQDSQPGSQIIVPMLEDPTVYWLGRFDPSTMPPVQGSTSQAIKRTSVQSSGDKKYLRQQWLGGTECDVTGKPRRIEIQFHCNMQAHERIALVKETTICHYLLVIHTPRLCKEPVFKSISRFNVNQINCSPIVSDIQYEAEKKRMLEGKQTADAIGKDIKDNLKKSIEEVLRVDQNNEENGATLGSDILQKIVKLAEDKVKTTMEDDKGGKRRPDETISELQVLLFDEDGRLIKAELPVDDSIGTKEELQHTKTGSEKREQQHSQSNKVKQLALQEVIKLLMEQGIVLQTGPGAGQGGFAAEQEKLSKLYEAVYNEEETGEQKKKDN